MKLIEDIMKRHSSDTKGYIIWLDSDKIEKKNLPPLKHFTPLPVITKAMILPFLGVNEEDMMEMSDEENIEFSQIPTQHLNRSQDTVRRATLNKSLKSRATEIVRAAKSVAKNIDSKRFQIGNTSGI